MNFKTYWIASILLCAALSLNISADLVSEQQPIRTGQDYALFFAVDDYASSLQFGNLQNPVRDAEAIAQELTDMYAFETHVYKNKSKAAIFDILRQWRERSFGTDDQLLIFFSGHGDFDDFTAKGYFIAHGNRSHQDAAYLDLSTLRNIITQMPCEHILLAVDACYSGTIDSKIAFKSNSRFKRPGSSSTTERDRLISTLLRNNTRLVVTSGGKERTPDGTDHSPFTNAFLRGLRAAYSHEDGLFTYSDLLGRLERVSPQPYTGTMNGHEEGSFVFVSSVLAPNNTPSTVTPANTSRNTTPSLEREGRGGSPDNFIRIPGGTFEMGDTFGEGEDREKPVHQVEVSTFYMSKYELTVAEFAAFVTATNYQTDAEKGDGSYIWRDSKWQEIAGINWRHDHLGKERTKNDYNHPVIHVSWCDAVAYANWLSERNGLQPVYSGNCDNIHANWNANGYRLPTEAEWEYAAREGGKKVRFGNGEDIIRSGEANFNASSDHKQSFSEVGPYRSNTIVVGSLNHPNALGLHDMSGNVYEWCWDWYDSDYYKKSPQNNPKGPDSGVYRVLRGGSWYDYPQYCRAAHRGISGPANRSSSFGFRLARGS